MPMHTFKVSGSGRFPLSMLRFDYAWPFTDEDANKIEETFDGFNRAKGRWTITLQSLSKYAPTPGRWDSFNCKVEDER